MSSAPSFPLTDRPNPTASTSRTTTRAPDPSCKYLYILVLEGRTLFEDEKEKHSALFFVGRRTARRKRTFGLRFLLEEVLGGVALGDGVVAEAGDADAALDGGALFDGGVPLEEVRVVGELEEGLGAVAVLDEVEPGPDRDVGDGVLGAAEVRLVGQVLVEDVELSFEFDRGAVEAEFKGKGCILVPQAEAGAAPVRRAADLPEQPVVALGLALQVARHEGVVVFFREVLQERAGLEDADAGVGVQHRRNFRVRVQRHEARTELVEVGETNLPRVVLDALRIVQFF
mmetsp:Transcript_23611/g.72634  ORF Transcript_23611/g.72634 Transcript_23611/m.72634 type:complete len:286 (-) Transcript_23611:249-1106(-)